MLYFNTSASVCWNNFHQCPQWVFVLNKDFCLQWLDLLQNKWSSAELNIDILFEKWFNLPELHEFHGVLISVKISRSIFLTVFHWWADYISHCFLFFNGEKIHLCTLENCNYTKKVFQSELLPKNLNLFSYFIIKQLPCDKKYFLSKAQWISNLPRNKIENKLNYEKIKITFIATKNWNQHFSIRKNEMNSLRLIIKTSKKWPIWKNRKEWLNVWTLA